MHLMSSVNKEYINTGISKANNKLLKVCVYQQNSISIKKLFVSM